jgi:hypothetical protein
MADPTKQIDFHFLKSPEYRSYHTDGVIGAFTPKGAIYISFYLERGPIPQKMTFEITVDGQVGSPLSQEGKTGIIRELECGVAMDLRAATDLRDTLNKMFDQIKKAEAT